VNNRIALGTAQFGSSYGIANRTGQVSRDEVSMILEYAWQAGVNTLDTAMAYGQSEQRLGEIGVEKWRIISKIPAVPDSCDDVALWVRESVLGSLERLKIPKLYGLLLHRPQQLGTHQGGELYCALDGLRDEGLVGKIGISIYSPDELDAIWPRFKLDLVQAPFNILDRRLETSGWLTRLHQAGVEVHIRSVFLQGLLLMSAQNRPAMFNRWQSLWDCWESWLKEQRTNPLQTCLGVALAQPGIDRVVVGIDSLKHVQEVLHAAKMKCKSAPKSLATDDIELLNPSRWAK